MRETMLRVAAAALMVTVGACDPFAATQAPPSWEAAVREVWPDEKEEWAVRVVRCESGGDVAARSRTGRYVGLFQVWVAHLRWLPEDADDLTDPHENARAGWLIYEKQGRRAWPVCGRR